MYAKVVIGLPVEGPFDYSVPKEYASGIRKGMRVAVGFGFRKSVVGYVVSLAKQTAIKKVKPIFKVLDDQPVLNEAMLRLTKAVSEYYCCSWGEAVETALPLPLRKPRSCLEVKAGMLPEIALFLKEAQEAAGPHASEPLLVHDKSGNKNNRFELYLERIKKAVSEGTSTIILSPDLESVLKIKEAFQGKFDCAVEISYRNQPQELSSWIKIKTAGAHVVVGTRSAVFAPVERLGLIIIDEEENPVYKQDQVPHYHPRVVASMRVKLEKASLIVGSRSPSLESVHEARKKMRTISIPFQGHYPEVKIMDSRSLWMGQKKKKMILSRYLQDSIQRSLEEKGKTLLLINRKGFATYASCNRCGFILQCQRCNVHLVFHFQENVVQCHYCNFKMAAPTVCPQCNSGYIKYEGAGTEKIESELSRLFPSARIRRADMGGHLAIQDADILVSTLSILKNPAFSFDLIGVLDIDASFNRPDFRASEKTFVLLNGLLYLTEKAIIIQTSLLKHYCIKSLVAHEPELFYREELKQRKSLQLPPFRHLGVVKLRGSNPLKVKECCERLYKAMENSGQIKSIQLVSFHPGQPPQLRGKAYWNIVLSAKGVKALSAFIKMNIRNFSHSGIIVTADIDPL